MPSPINGRVTCLLAAAAAFATAAAASPRPAVLEAPPAPPAVEKTTAPESAAAEPAPKFIRSVEASEGQVLRLETVIRTFAPADGGGPTIDIVGAVHIADQSFYDALQTFLDEKDVVLFEGVKPGGTDHGDDAAATDEERAARTRKRIRLLAALAESHMAREGEYPESIEALAAGADKRIGWLVDNAASDAWERPLVYTLVRPDESLPPTFDILSLGADAEPGGEDAAADIAFSNEPPLTNAERVSDDPGIQQQLASALGLVFQLDAMDHSGENWRNSDMTIDELQERLDAAGADAGVLLKTLDGSSLSAKFLSLALRFIGANPTYSAMAKMMLLDMLARADELMAAAPGNMGTMMAVIIHDRNDVVLDDLRGVLEDEPGVESIGIIYGAGHLADIQSRLVSDFGYVESGERWVPAIELDLNKSGIPLSQAKQLRAMMRRSLDQQMKTLERQRERQQRKQKDSEEK